MMLPCRLDGDIIFIQQQYRLFPIVRFQKAQQERHRIHALVKRARSIQDHLKMLSIVRIQIILQQKIVCTEQIAKPPPHTSLQHFPRQPVPAFQREEQDRPCSLHRHRFRIVYDLQSIEQLSVFLRMIDGKEIPEHGKRQRLAETTRTCKERHLGMCLQKRAKKRRLVHKIIAAPHICEIIPANRHHHPHRTHLICSILKNSCYT